jgi:hypothetical protein
MIDFAALPEVDFGELSWNPLLAATFPACPSVFDSVNTTV